MKAGTRVLVWLISGAFELTITAKHTTKVGVRFDLRFDNSGVAWENVDLGRYEHAVLA